MDHGCWLHEDPDLPKTKMIPIIRMILCKGKESSTIPLALLLAKTIKEIIHPDLCR